MKFNLILGPAGHYDRSSNLGSAVIEDTSRPLEFFDKRKN